MTEQGLNSVNNCFTGLSVIIVNYYSTSLLKKCISGIIEHFKTVFEIIVVDNNTAGFNESDVMELYPKVKVIVLKENLGFGRANNIAAEKAANPFLLILNPDTEINSDFASEIVSFMNADPLSGACGPVLYHTDGRVQYSAGSEKGLKLELSEAFFLVNFLRKRFFTKILNDHKNAKPVEVSWISAACLIIKKNLFKEIGGFDPDYFMNYEDIDLCTRLLNKGYKNYIFSGLKCTHFDQAIQKKDYRKMVTSRYQSKLIFLKKHFSVTEKRFILLCNICGIFLKLLFVNILYSKEEKKGRRKGYRDSLALSFNAF